MIRVAGDDAVLGLPDDVAAVVAAFGERSDRGNAHGSASFKRGGRPETGRGVCGWSGLLARLDAGLGEGAVPGGVDGLLAGQGFRRPGRGRVAAAVGAHVAAAAAALPGPSGRRAPPGGSGSCRRPASGQGEVRGGRRVGEDRLAAGALRRRRRGGRTCRSSRPCRRRPRSRSSSSSVGLRLLALGASSWSSSSSSSARRRPLLLALGLAVVVVSGYWSGIVVGLGLLALRLLVLLVVVIVAFGLAAARPGCRRPSSSSARAPRRARGRPGGRSGSRRRTGDHPHGMILLLRWARAEPSGVERSAMAAPGLRRPFSGSRGTLRRGHDGVGEADVDAGLAQEGAGLGGRTAATFRPRLRATVSSNRRRPRRRRPAARRAPSLRSFSSLPSPFKAPLVTRVALTPFLSRKPS
jgi:hypothetical protein